jgi:hypothetical protein
LFFCVKNKMGDSSSQAGGELSSNIRWTVKLEEYFASTGEKAHCLSWVHKQAEQMYSTRRTFIDLPVIVGSGVVAFLNAGSSSMFDDPRLSSIALGIGSLCIGVLNTLGSYFGWAKRSEGHRISAIHYAKLYRFITVELALPREERMSPHDFLKYVKDQYDRLQEISPLVPPSVIRDFQRKFKNEHEISKPEEANGLEKITVYRRTDEEVDADRTVGAPTPNPAATMKTNPMLSIKKPVTPTKKDEKYLPTAKALEQVAESVSLPEAPEALARPPSPTRLRVIQEETPAPSS